MTLAAEMKAIKGDRFQLDSTPQAVARLPFASESGLQQFFEEHAKQLLGVDIVASARRGGNMIFKIDLLAVDPSGRPWIIECKHDLVDAQALKQLHRYRVALVSQWRAVREVLATRQARVLQEKVNPVLVLIGYRYDQNFADNQTLCFAYRYHDIEFTSEELQTQKPGRVSLHNMMDIVTPVHPHPKVCKKIATYERLVRLVPASAAKSFWKVDAELQGWGNVKVKYGGKNFVRYSSRVGKFAEAVICPGRIQWRITLNHGAYLERDSDVSKVLKVLQEAYHQAR